MRGVQRGNWLELLEGKGFMLILSEPCLVAKFGYFFPETNSLHLKHWGWKILEDEFPFGFRPPDKCYDVSFREGIFGLRIVDLEFEIYDGNGFMTMGRK